MLESAPLAHHFRPAILLVRLRRMYVIVSPTQKYGSGFIQSIKGDYVFARLHSLHPLGTFIPAPEGCR